MGNALVDYLVCLYCGSSNKLVELEFIKCIDCNKKITVKNRIPRFVDGAYHSNFGLQWNEFSTVQLDSINGSDESEKRLLTQSKLMPEDFKGKIILEVGAGNGRFTEIFLKYGARVIAVDYSSAIDANLKNHAQFIDEGRLLLVQGDLFDLPVTENFFDMVFCYGVIQHTGNNQKAIFELSKYPRNGGHLFIDIYSTSIKHFNPLIYLIRPFFSLLKVDEERRLEIVEKFVKWVFPFQLRTLRLLYGKEGILKVLRWVINRSPNSVYGINLYCAGKIDINFAYKWSVMDTYDSWAPKHDHPVSKQQWIRLITVLEKQGFRVDNIDLSGQGHTAILSRKE
jgi:ubiquinone/menaquinone biosynthesis C-methylase UbiE/DNA-directed RNA polymerase subunit RPC12/RpoP